MRWRFRPRLDILPGFGPRRHSRCTLLGHGPLLRRALLLWCALLRYTALLRCPALLRCTLLRGGLARLRSGTRLGLWIGAGLRAHHAHGPGVAGSHDTRA